MSENETQQGIDMDARRVRDGTLDQVASDPPFPMCGMNVNADFGGFAIGWPAVKRGEAEPGLNAALVFAHPQRAGCGIMCVEPCDAALDRYRIDVGGDHAGRDCRVVNVDDLLQIFPCRDSV